MPKQIAHFLVAAVIFILIIISGILWLHSDTDTVTVSYPSATASGQLLPDSIETAYLNIIQYLNQTPTASTSAYQVVITADPNCTTCYTATVTLPDGTSKNYAINGEQIAPLINDQQP